MTKAARSVKQTGTKMLGQHLGETDTRALIQYKDAILPV